MGLEQIEHEHAECKLEQDEGEETYVSELRDIPSFPVKSIMDASTTETLEIDNAVRKNAIESDRAYRKITTDIIDKTSSQLSKHTEAKTPLRKLLLVFVIILLSAQFIALIFILVTNRALKLEVSDFVINVYVVSLFVETLAGLLIMIRFSFDSTQEVELIKVLNAIISNFKKYDDK